MLINTNCTTYEIYPIVPNRRYLGSFTRSLRLIKSEVLCFASSLVTPETRRALCFVRTLAEILTPQRPTVPCRPKLTSPHKKEFQGTVQAVIRWVQWGSFTIHHKIRLTAACWHRKFSLIGRGRQSICIDRSKCLYTPVDTRRYSSNELANKLHTSSESWSSMHPG